MDPIGLIDDPNLAAAPHTADKAVLPQNAPHKRTRVLLSCAPCRLSKLKCDRAVPCSNCLKKGRTDICTYAPRPKKPPKPASGMASRLRRLEGMLREMMDDENTVGGVYNFGEAAPPPVSSSSTGPNKGSSARPPPETDHYRSEFAVHDTAETTGQKRIGKLSGNTTGGAGSGRVVRGKTATTYVGATHFMAMLDDIEDLKAYFDQPETEDDEVQGQEQGRQGQDQDQGLIHSWDQMDNHHPPQNAESPEMIMMGAKGLRSKSDLLAILPERSVVDRLIMRYFASNTPSQHTMHRPTFSKRYSEFWQDPSQADMEWLAVLYGIMALGVHFSTFSAPHETLFVDASSPAPVDRFRLYRSASSRALASSKFTAPSLRTIQALLIYVEMEFMLNRASQTNCWLLSAVCIRLMLNLGMHRDPSRLPNLSIFEGEMRRRMWNLGIQLDLICSFHMGLPSMIHGIPSDTGLAHNLLDEDFDESTLTLPTPRPDTEYTYMSYPIFKSMVCRVFGQVARLAHTLTPPTYAEVLRTDALLEEKWHQIPAFMKVRPLGECVADPPAQVVQRFGLASLYQKSRCVLHRRYLAEPVLRPEHAYSRRTCLQAALTLLEYQEFIHEATRPGGLLSEIGWFVSGLGMHDFLLASMIVYLVVQNDTMFDPELLSSCGGGSSGSGSGGGSNRNTPATTTSSFSFSPSVPPLSESLPVDRDALIDILYRTSRIWQLVAVNVPEVKKAWVLLDAMLRKIHTQEPRRATASYTPGTTATMASTATATAATPATTTTTTTATTTPATATTTALSGTSVANAMPTRPALPPHPGFGLGPVPPGPVPPTIHPTYDHYEDVQIGFSRNDLVPPAAPVVASVQPEPPIAIASAALPSVSSASSANATGNHNDGQNNVFDMAGMALPENPYDGTWIPMTLDALDWGTVDDRLRQQSLQPSEWADQAGIDDINYLATGLWEQNNGDF